MYAVILTGGKQYKVAVGEEVFVEKLEGEAGEAVTFDTVLAVSDESGMKAGDDVKAVKVSGEIVKQGKDKKIVVYKYKPRRVTVARTDTDSLIRESASRRSTPDRSKRTLT
jgi:large subunit ribosomal protein L21